jgi:hypothetical protein
MRSAAARLSGTEGRSAVSRAVADWLEETARQFDAPPCDDPSGVCTPCEWRPDFNDALRVAEAVLAEFPLAAEAVSHA